MIAGFIHLVWKVIWNVVVVLVCAGLIFIGYKANQPMSVAGAPKGMTYVEFIQDRLEAAKTVEPSRCGLAINPEGTLAKITEYDPDIPKGVEGAKWYEIPGIWWSVVERLSWTMLGKPANVGCQFRAVR